MKNYLKRTWAKKGVEIRAKEEKRWPTSKKKGLQGLFVEVGVKDPPTSEHVLVDL